MKNLYLIGGLGADKRVFDNYNFPGSKTYFIEWLIPIKNESINQYSLRLSKQIKTKKNNIIIGVSFGGIIAIELSHIMNFEKIILISSAKQSIEIPFIYKLIGKLKILNFIPHKLFNKYTFLTSYYFGLTNKKEKNLLKNIINDTNPYLIKWSLKNVTQWKNDKSFLNLIQIHGTKDKLFPIRNINDPIIIDEGSHFMIVNKSKEINDLLLKLVA